MFVIFWAVAIVAVPVGIYLFQIINENTTAIKVKNRDTFIVNFELVSHIE